jgi:hypothetical protein
MRIAVARHAFKTGEMKTHRIAVKTAVRAVALVTGHSPVRALQRISCFAVSRQRKRRRREALVGVARVAPGGRLWSVELTGVYIAMAIGALFKAWMEIRLRPLARVAFAACCVRVFARQRKTARRM